MEKDTTHLEACFDKLCPLLRKCVEVLRVVSSHGTCPQLFQCKWADVCKGSQRHRKGLNTSAEKNQTVLSEKEVKSFTFSVNLCWNRFLSPNFR